jgi:hypothetical protein
MKTGKGKIEELFLDGSARISCTPELIPPPGQYVLAHADGSDASLPVPLFSSLPLSQNGFRSAPPLPPFWHPGTSLSLRGPIGHGFMLPVTARKIALIAFDDVPARVLGLVSLGLKQNAEIVLVTNFQQDDLPEVVEVQPLKGLGETLQWADYAAVDVSRENLNQLREMLVGKDHFTVKVEAQVLVRAPMPCGALADCGVCALSLHHEWKMVCKDGPVFALRDIT